MKGFHFVTYIGSLDQGTSSTRFMIFDHSGKVIGQHQLEHRQIMPHPGWVEHDAAEIWQRVQEVIAGALKQADILGSDLEAIGITNQRETTVVWDVSTGQPLSNAIVWQDTRTTDFLSSLTDSQKEKAIKSAQKYLHSNGVTSIHDVDSLGGFEILKKMYANNELDIRVYSANPLYNWKALSNKEKIKTKCIITCHLKSLSE